MTDEQSVEQVASESAAPVAAEPAPRPSVAINGYKLQHALRELESAREVAAQQFSANILQFESQDDKQYLPDVFARFTALENKIAQVQCAQASYNLAVTVDVLGQKMSLHKAVKLVGGAGRAEKMWRTVVKGGEQTNNRYFSQETSRTKENEYAKRSISVADALAHAKHAAKLASALRQAIQLGNAVSANLEGLDPSTLES